MYSAVKPHYTALFLKLPKDAKRSKVNSSPVTGASNPANHHGWRDFALIWHLSGLCRLPQQMLPEIVQAAHSCLVRSVAECTCRLCSYSYNYLGIYLHGQRQILAKI